jgi:hypothetical protein
MNITIVPVATDSGFTFAMLGPEQQDDCTTPRKPKDWQSAQARNDCIHNPRTDWRT